MEQQPHQPRERSRFSTLSQLPQSPHLYHQHQRQDYFHEDNMDLVSTTNTTSATGQSPSGGGCGDPTQRHRHDRSRNKEGYEFVGFILYLLSFVFFGIYLAWSYLPDRVLHSFGIYYYSSRYWAVALPVYVLTCFAVLLVLVVAWDLILTPPLNSLYTITDEHASVMHVSPHVHCWSPSTTATAAPPSRDQHQEVKHTYTHVSPSSVLSQPVHPEEDPIPELQDLPLSLVNACLYQNHAPFPQC